MVHVAFLSSAKRSTSRRVSAPCSLTTSTPKGAGHRAGASAADGETYAGRPLGYRCDIGRFLPRVGLSEEQEQHEIRRVRERTGQDGKTYYTTIGVAFLSEKGPHQREATGSRLAARWCCSLRSQRMSDGHKARRQSGVGWR